MRPRERDGIHFLPSPGDRDTFSHREFSFTLEDDVYVRYQSFESRQALEEGVRKSRPFKIDIGAIFSVKPSMRSRVQQASFKALRKELVFDIDMTDYDDTRTCCREAKICQKCWKFMTIAMRILDRALRGWEFRTPLEGVLIFR